MYTKSQRNIILILKGNVWNQLRLGIDLNFVLIPAGQKVRILKNRMNQTDQTKPTKKSSLNCTKELVESKYIVQFNELLIGKLKFIKPYC